DKKEEDKKEEDGQSLGQIQVDKYFTKKYYTGYVNDPELTNRLIKAEVHDFRGEVPEGSNGILELIVVWIIPFVAIYLVMYLLFRSISKSGGGIGGVGKSKAKVYIQKETGVSFKNVAGQDEAKESLTEIVDFLHHPGKYTRIGAKLPKGALLVGPPGTGKTLLARAVAGEAKVPFFSLTGSDFVEMFVGVGASRVRDLFENAKKQAPCIVFIDEIDAIGKSRDAAYGGSNDEREQTLNQLLSEMDGFDGSEGVVILAATNRPEVLDKALLRPGRFDRRIIVDKPDLKGREEVLRVHSKDVLMHDSVNLRDVALATPGAVGSDLANMINEAAILAVKNGRKVVTQEDLLESVEIVIAGKEKKDRVMNKEEKNIVAYHEIGHALVTASLKGTEPVAKITIVPRTMGSLGYVMQLPEEEKYLMSKDDLTNRVITLFGGRAAEELVFDSVTTGASNDIEKATQIARAMITQYGMSEKFGLMGIENVQNRYLDGRPVSNCADATAAEVDKEVMRFLSTCYDKAKEILSKHRETLDKLAAYLFEKETINGKEFMDIYNKTEEIPIVSKEEEKEKEKDEDKEKEEEKEDELKE
ncbi:MAG TPA: ATP-dependent zinc metalloprotease FtsH, partial [Clostridiales bacterium]|nr:ATP-dependent zinc metalloprotease FtsH [Clostridiales bacterium]